jgi:hypothetical protein
MIRAIYAKLNGNESLQFIYQATDFMQDGYFFKNMFHREKNRPQKK